MYHVVVVIVAAVLLGSTRSANVNRHMKQLAKIDIEPNAIQVQSIRKFVSITHRPDATYAHTPGTTTTLTCDAIGGPAPSIHWFKNDAPVYEFDMESNELIDSNPTSVARVSSTLLITKTEGQDIYTCVVTGGSKTAKASTIVYSTDDSTDLTERAKLFPLEPKIVVSYKMYLDVIGSNIVLPCRVKGHPRPQVTWRNNKGVIVKQDPRMKVLRSGELVISALRWSDMGEFTCHATNAFGSQLSKTFVYPAKAG